MDMRKVMGIMAALAAMAVTAEPARAQVDVDVDVVLRLPVGHVWIDVGRDRYAYYDGYYYRPHRSGRGYVRATLPMGAILLRLPPYARHRYVPGYGDCYYDGGLWYRPAYREGVLVFIVLGPEPPRVIRRAPYSYRPVRPPVRVHRPPPVRVQRPAPVRRAPPVRRPARVARPRPRAPTRARPPRARPERPAPPRGRQRPARPARPRPGSRPPPG